MGKIEDMRRSLPYGKYIFEDGSQILFNRRYEILAGGKMVEASAEMKLRVYNAKKLRFYNDSNPPWIDKKKNISEMQSYPGGV